MEVIDKYAPINKNHWEKSAKSRALYRKNNSHFKIFVKNFLYFNFLDLKFWSQSLYNPEQEDTLSWKDLY